MGSTLNVSSAQARLSNIVSGDDVVAISKRETVRGYYVPAARMEALLDSIDFLSNPKALAALTKYRAGKMKFKTLAEVERELEASDAR